MALLGSMSIAQCLTCALVCSDWAKAAAATTHSIVKHDLRNVTGLQRWLEKNGGQIKTLQLHVDIQSAMSALPCAQLQDLLLHSKEWDNRLTLGGSVWSDVAAATKLTSVSLQQVCTDSQQADMVSALAALPDLQQLTLDVECQQKQELSDSRLLQHLTKLTGLELGGVSAEALQHLGSLSKLQHLNLGEFNWLAAADIPGLQLTALTSLQVDSRLDGLPSAVSNSARLQKLKVWVATPTELSCLKGFTVLTKLHVGCLVRDATPLQLPALHVLDLTVEDDEAVVLHMSELSSCSQLRRLGLQGFSLTGPASLAPNSMLQKLYLCDCSLSSPGGPACGDPWRLLFPGAGQLPHLTSLVLWSVSPAPQQADLERLVACCNSLHVLKLPSFQRLTSASAFQCLSLLTNLVTLHLSTVEDQQCSSLAQLSGLQELEVTISQELSSEGLRDVARLQHLTRLGFVGDWDDRKVSSALQAQLDARVYAYGGDY